MSKKNVIVSLVLGLLLASCLLIAGCNDDETTGDTTTVRLSLLDSVDPGGECRSVVTDGDYVYVATLDLKLLVFDISSDSLRQIASLDLNGSEESTAESLNLVQSGDYLYIAAYDLGLVTIDVSDPAVPFIASPPYEISPWKPFSVTITGDRLYLCRYRYGYNYSSLAVFDISFPASPRLLGEGSMMYGRKYVSCTMDNDFVFVIDRYTGFVLYDVSDPTAPRYIGRITGEGDWFWGSAKVDDYLLVGGGGTGLLVYNAQESTSIPTASLPTTNIVDPSPADQSAFQILLKDQYAYVADGYNGVVVANVRNITSPYLVDRLQTGGKITGISVGNDRLVAVDQFKGIYLFRVDQVDMGTDTDGDGLSNEDDLDDDRDGLPDLTDLNPFDTDNDGIDNEDDLDDDGDGQIDTEDPYLFDTDNDGMMNDSDSDDDNDGVTDDADDLPLDPTEFMDTDGDRIGNNADPDDDNDGVVDEDDVFPLDSTESSDSDGDLVGDNADAFPDDPTESLDTDEDLIGNNVDVDDDGDARTDATDAFPLDTDNDGIENSFDADDDNDGVFDAQDVFPFDEEEWEDLDGDGLGDRFPNNRYALIEVTHFDTIQGTILGTIKLELFEDRAPLTTRNFIRLAKDGFYNGVIFHRVAKDFVVQGGDPLGTGYGGPGYKIPDEILRDESGELLISHDAAGILSMAKTSEPDSGGSQFFITVREAVDSLDGIYSAFGRVVDGFDVVQAIHDVPVIDNDGDPSNGIDGPPVDDVVMTSVTIVTE